MDRLDVHEATTHLPCSVEKAAKGESSVIVRVGKPLLKVVPLDAPMGSPKRRVGLLKGVYAIPDDFGAFGRDGIEEVFCDPEG